MMQDWWYGGGWGGGMFFGPLFMLGGPLLLIILVVVLVRWLSDSRDSPGRHLRTPREILDERLAKGEIERAEYEERKKLLSSS
jgi:putative membrane protein